LDPLIPGFFRHASTQLYQPRTSTADSSDGRPQQQLNQATACKLGRPDQVSTSNSGGLLSDRPARLPGLSMQAACGACTPAGAAASAGCPAVNVGARKLEHVLEALGVEHDIKEYPDAEYALLNDHEGAATATR
jgi:hypothetical protein